MVTNKRSYRLRLESSYLRAKDKPIDCKLTLPTQPVDSLGVVVMSHGLGSSKDSERITALEEALAREGVASLSYDAPLHGSSYGASRKVSLEDDELIPLLQRSGVRKKVKLKDLRGFKISEWVSALEDAVSFALTELESRVGIPVTGVALYGNSVGSYPTLLVAGSEDYKDHVKAVGLVSPVTNLERLLSPRAEEVLEEQGAVIVQTEDKAYLVDKRLKEDFRAARSYEAEEKPFSKISAPVLILAGSEDLYLSEYDLRGLLEKLENVPVVEFVPYESGHDLSEPKTFKDTVKRLTNHFSTYLV